jgi:hypothetical protein
MELAAIGKTAVAVALRRRALHVRSHGSKLICKPENDLAAALQTYNKMGCPTRFRGAPLSSGGPK